jgi:hypothetical protein
MTEEEYSLAVENMTLHESLIETSPNFVKPANKLNC